MILSKPWGHAQGLVYRIEVCKDQLLNYQPERTSGSRQDECRAKDLGD